MKAHGLFGHHRQMEVVHRFHQTAMITAYTPAIHYAFSGRNPDHDSRSNILFCLALYQLLRGLYEPLTDLLLKALYALLLRQIC